MKIKAKTIGSEVSLDDYNAFQYLLYNMTGWTEWIYLDWATEHEGDFGTYLMTKPVRLIADKSGTFKVKQKLGETSQLNIKLTSVKKIFDERHMEFTCTLYYKKPQIINGIEYLPDGNELKRFSTVETHPSPEIEKDFQQIELPCTLSGNTFKISLWDNVMEEAYLSTNDILNRWIKINIKLNSVPYIDIRNGIANDPEEIIVENEAELKNIIRYAPTDGTQTTIRLDGNHTYTPTSTMTIKTGQNIIIRGGSGEWIDNTTTPPSYKTGKTILDGTRCHRMFIVQYDASLKLDHVYIRNCNSTPVGTYERGKGGAILVEAIRRASDGKYAYGTLSCNECLFYKNKSWNGGAIYAYNTGLFLDTCDFISNEATLNGGAVYYYARDVKLNFTKINKAYKGKDIILTVDVTDYFGRVVGEGEIDFYWSHNGAEKLITPKPINVPEYDSEELNQKKGQVQFTYQIPEKTTLNQYVFVAVYRSGATYDEEATTMSVKIINPHNAVATIATDDTIELGSTKKLKGLITDKDLGKQVTKLGNAYFNIDGEEYTVKKIDADGYYILYYDLSLTYTGKTINISFGIRDEEYTCNIAEKTLTVTDYIVDNKEMNINNANNITGVFIEPLNNGSSDLALKSGSKTDYVDKRITLSLLENFREKGVTDVFVRCIIWGDKERSATLRTISDLIHQEDIPIRLHAVINCFYNADGTTINSQWGTKTPKNTERINLITDRIESILKGALVDGIILDYCRFNGDETDTKGYYNGGVATNERSNYVNKAIQTFTNKIQEIKKDTWVGLVVIPDNKASEKYGQDYQTILNTLKRKDKKTPCVDYLVPKIFMDDYSVDASNIKKVNTEIVKHLEKMDTSGINYDKLISMVQCYYTKGNTPQAYDETTSNKVTKHTEILQNIVNTKDSSNKQLKGNIWYTYGHFGKTWETFPKSFKELNEE